MIDVYFWPTGNGKKITTMLEERGLPYDVIPVNINKGGQVTPEYDAINPNNKMPAIIDRDAPAGPLTDLHGRYRVLWQVGGLGSYGWQGQDLDDYPNVKRWFETVGDRPAVRT